MCETIQCTFITSNKETVKLYKMKVVPWKHQHGTEGMGGRRMGRLWSKYGLKLHTGRRRRRGKVVPILLYRCENWTSLKQHDRRIETAEMKFLRPIVGYTLYDHKAKK
jgi:hypothetical protein